MFERAVHEPGDISGNAVVNYGFSADFRSKMTKTLRCSYAVKRCSACASTKTALPLSDGDLFTLHLEDARAFKHDVGSVVLVRLLSVGLRGDEHIDPDFEAGGFVDDLMPPPASRSRSLTAATSNGCMPRTYFTRTISRRTLSSPTVFIDPAQA